jgi:hypothetical protein
MPGKAIGKSLNNGFAGNFARNPDLIAVTRPNNSATPILFGSALMYDAVGGVTKIDGTFTFDKFVGIAGSAVKSAFNYIEQGERGGEYAPKEPVTVVQRGSISVICANGTPAVGGAVYIRKVADGTKAIGDIEAVSDSTKSILITNAQWGSDADTNGIAELVLLTRNRA